MKKRSANTPSQKTRVAVGVGTSQGGFLLISDLQRNKWRKVGPFLHRESVNCLKYDAKSKTLFAATHTNGVFVSKDFGKTWKQSNDGLHVKKTWTIEFDPNYKNTLYVGTHYGHLFKSTNLGANWEEVSGLFTAPKRNEWGVDWGFGTVGLCIHTIKMDPNQKDRFYIVSSGGGPYRTDVGGNNWSLLDNGVKSTCNSEWASADVWRSGEKDPAKNLERHLAEVHRCTHKLAVSVKNPGTVYQQNHCGVYKSSDSGQTWTDISPSNTLRHGFPIVLVESPSSNNGGTLFTIPAFQGGPCKEHNSCIKGDLAVYRTADGGKSWDRLTEGLPKKNHTCILRDAMSIDPLDPAGIYFGTTTGQVYYSKDLGESWSKALDGAGRVQGISSFTIKG
ncbi:MAG: hypothetical protein JRN52_01120 [Nitrososphaerota archaeon]|nr:hypothetical protein [Nitrososphaerota archaeon]